MAWVVFIFAVNFRLLIKPDMARGNAREAASLVARELKPDDLIIVSPQWHTSSFYYYFDAVPGGRRLNPRLNYPTDAFPGVVYYDDVRRRLLDIPTYRRALDVIERSRLERRRIWFIADLDRIDVFDLNDAPVDSDRVRGDFLDYLEIGDVRAAQIRRHLRRLYGPPRVVLRPKMRSLREVDGIELYEPKSAAESAAVLLPTHDEKEERRP